MRPELGGSPVMSSWLLATFNPSSREWPQAQKQTGEGPPRRHNNRWALSCRYFWQVSVNSSNFLGLIQLVCLKRIYNVFKKLSVDISVSLDRCGYFKAPCIGLKTSLVQTCSCAPSQNWTTLAAVGCLRLITNGAYKMQTCFRQIKKTWKK